jgi:Cys-tRNA(Pro)/Cys-tRNA(Cys) deacylase
MRTSVDVHNFLLERDVPHELVPVRGRFRSPDRVAAVLGLSAEQVGKVLVYAGSKGPVAVLIPSDRDPDLKRVAVAVPTPTLTALGPDEIADATDYLAEAVPPVGLPGTVRVVMDRRLTEQDVLYFAGGETRTLLKIRPEDLRRAADAKVAKVTK